MNSDAILLMLADLLIKGAAIFSAAFTAQHIMRRSSAARIHLVWLAAFVALLLFPLTKFAQPRWSYVISKTTPATTILMNLPPMKQATTDEATSTVIADAKGTMVLPNTGRCIVALWLAGAALILSRRWIGCWQLCRLKRDSSIVSDSRVIALMERFGREMEVHKSVELRLSARVAVPLTWGITRSVLMLPTSALDWNDERLGAALRHEMGHIKRRDVLSRWLAVIVCAFHWMNPLAWFAARAMRTVQERACDDLVLNAGCSAEGYATQLLDVTRSMQSSFHILPALAMAQPSTLETRLVAIVDAQRDRSAAGRGAMIAGAAMTGLALLMGASAQVGAADNAKAAKQIVISTNIIEADAGSVRGILAGVAPVSGVTVLMSEAQGQDLIRELRLAKGVDFLSAPRVTTVSGQKATIQIGQDVGVQKEPVKTVFQGVSVALVPTLEESGTVKLAVDALVRTPHGNAESPVFSTHTVKTDLEAEPGQVIALMMAAADGEKKEVLLLITAQIAGPHGIKAEAKPDSASDATAKPGVVRREDLSKLIISKLDFNEATVEEALDFLRVKGRALDPKKQGVNIVLKKPETGELPLITLSLTNIPLVEVLRYVATLSNLELTADGAAMLLHPKNKPAAPQPEKAETSAAKKAAQIIIPAFEVREAGIEAVVDFLRLKAKELDPEKSGVNLIVKDAGVAKNARITLSLENVPLLEALKYAAALSGMEIEAGEHGIILKGKHSK